MSLSDDGGRESTVLRAKMGGPGLARLVVGRLGQIWGVGVGGDHGVTGSISAGVARIKGAPRHVLVTRSRRLGGRAGKGARGGGGTRLKHRNRATLLGDRLNQRSHIVLEINECQEESRVLRSDQTLDTATRGRTGVTARRDGGGLLRRGKCQSVMAGIKLLWYENKFPSDEGEDVDGDRWEEKETR